MKRASRRRVRCTHCTKHRWKGNSAAHGRYKRREQGTRDAMAAAIREAQP